MSYAVLAEDLSDAETIAVFIRRLTLQDALRVKRSGYGGRDELLKKGAIDLRNFARQGFSRFVVCSDADGPNPAIVEEQVRHRIILPAAVAEPTCIVVPVQELEAWILADIRAVTRLFPSWKPKAVRFPENVANPKEELIWYSRDQKRRQRYYPATDNPRIANHLDLELIYKKCPSFRPFRDFVCEPT